MLLMLLRESRSYLVEIDEAATDAGLAPCPILSRMEGKRITIDHKREKNRVLAFLSSSDLPSPNLCYY